MTDQDGGRDQSESRGATGERQALFWPASSLAGDQDAIMANLERNTPVRLMATMGDLTVAFADERTEVALARARDHRFDFLPVRRAQGEQIVGLFSCDDVLADRCGTDGSQNPPRTGPDRNCASQSNRPRKQLCSHKRGRRRSRSCDSAGARVDRAHSETHHRRACGNGHSLSPTAPMQKTYLKPPVRR